MRIKGRFCLLMLLSAVLICGFAVREAEADMVSPSAWASIHDGPIDGFGDSLNGQSGLLGRASAGLLPEATYDDRVIVEFDLAFMSGQLLTSATLDFTVEALNISSPAVRAYDVFVYEGDAAATLSDFAAAAAYMDTIAYTAGAPTAFSIDVLGTLTQLYDGGATCFGVRIEPIGSRNPASLIANAPVLNVQMTDNPIPEPATVTILMLGGVFLAARRRR